jgi:hypothetical protein
VSKAIPYYVPMQPTLVVGPSGDDASNEYRFAQVLEAGVPKKWTFEFEIEPEEQGLLVPIRSRPGDTNQVPTGNSMGARFGPS